MNLISQKEDVGDHRETNFSGDVISGVCLIRCQNGELECPNWVKFCKWLIWSDSMRDGMEHVICVLHVRGMLGSNRHMCEDTLCLRERLFRAVVCRLQPCILVWLEWCTCRRDDVPTWHQGVTLTAFEKSHWLVDYAICHDDDGWWGPGGLTHWSWLVMNHNLKVMSYKTGIVHHAKCAFLCKQEQSIHSIPILQ